MISFTLKGINFDPRAKYWGPNAYHIVNGEWVYFVPVGVDPEVGLLVTEIARYQGVPVELGFMVFFRDSAGEPVYGPYGASSTALFILKDGAKYTLDFHGEVGIPTLSEEAPPEGFPSWAKGVAMLIPWSPLFGPPLPKGFFPPWPMWMSRWTEIPGYPKIPEE